jgi:hypothetical protein
MRLRSAVKILGAAAAFGLAVLPMSASAGCGCRAITYAAHYHGHGHAYQAPAVVYHRNQYPTAYYNEAAPPYYPRAHRHHRPHHPPLHRYY